MAKNGSNLLNLHVPIWLLVVQMFIYRLIDVKLVLKAAPCYQHSKCIACKCVLILHLYIDQNIRTWLWASLSKS